MQLRLMQLRNHIRARQLTATKGGLGRPLPWLLVDGAGREVGSQHVGRAGPDRRVHR
jgi:hypothetical protein